MSELPPPPPQFTLSQPTGSTDWFGVQPPMQPYSASQNSYLSEARELCANRNSAWAEYDIALNFDTTINGIHYLFFVGRTNPPHAGHIANIKSLIRSGLDLKKAGIIVKVFLLLGDGPANDRESNPIDLPLKRQIIFNHVFKRTATATSATIDDDRFTQSQLESVNFDIFLNRNPCGLIREIIRDVFLEQKQILDQDINISKASATLFVGDKGDDSVKLAPLLTSAKGELTILFDGETTIDVKTQALEPIQSTTDIPLSSTIIRKVANDALLGQDPINIFITNTGNFYTEEEATGILSQIDRVNKTIAAEKAESNYMRLINVLNKINAKPKPKKFTEKEDRDFPDKSVIPDLVKEAEVTRERAAQELAEAEEAAATHVLKKQKNASTNIGGTNKRKHRKSKRRYAYKTRTKRNKRRTKKRY